MCSEFVGALFAMCIQLMAYGGNANDPVVNGEFEYGVNMYLAESDVQQAGDFTWEVQKYLDRIDNAGLNSISLTWPIFTDGSRSNNVFVGNASLTVESVVLFTNIAKARGFSVWLHPIIDEKVLLAESNRHWRGNIRPPNPDVWFDQYQDIIMSYAVANADGFVIGTELWSMEPYHDNWATIVSDLREVFDGELTYASNRGVGPSDFNWNLVDIIGVNYFPNLDTPASEPEELGREIRQYVSSVIGDSVLVGLPVMITETGTTSQFNSLSVTGRWNHRTRPDQETQRLFYEVVCKEWSAHVEGIYWWNNTLYPIPEEDVATDIYFDAFGKITEQEVNCRSK